MMNSTVDDEEFPPNPFRSGGPPSQQQSKSQPKYQYQDNPLMQPHTQFQQQPIQEEAEDFFSNQISTAPPLSTTPSPMSPMTNNNISGNIQGNTMPAPPPRSRWQACVACCNMATYQQYFDIDTVDISTRIKASVTSFYQPDHFRTQICGSLRTDELKGPDLYGPFWIIMTLVFLLAVTSNLHAYIHSDNMDEFEYDIDHLLHAMTTFFLFGFCAPTLFWILTQCMSMQALTLAEWICLYGYSFVAFMPAALLCLIPWHVIEWLVLSIATAISAILVLRNVAGPLLASDVSQTKSGPLLLAILGTHVILLLTLKLAFYHHK